MEYKFYGWETAAVKPINHTYSEIHSEYLKREV